MKQNMRKPGPAVKNPVKLLKRLFQYILKDYKIHIIIVLICIIASVLANVQGTMFTKTLID